MNKLLRAGLTITSLATMVIASACGAAVDRGASGASQAQAASASGEKPLEKVRYAAFNGVSGLAVQFGASKGFFKDEGLDVEFISTQDPIAGLTSKDLDIADAATTSAIIAGGKGAPLKIVSSLFRTKGPFYLIARPDINSIEELKGKKVGAAAFGSGLDVYTQTILKKHGLSKTDVTYLANGVNDAAFASLTSGQVDATIIHEPFASLAEASGKGKLLAKGWDYLPDFHTGVIISRTDFVEKHPETVKKLLRAYFKSQEYAKSHLPEYKEYFLSKVKVDAAAADKAFERENVLWENNPNVDKQALLSTQQTQLELGLQDQIYDVDKLLDLRYIPGK
ncbi:NitT/TauT family transport system substrate-binding protein [Paenibacillus sp. UNCCL117]|uniref:ABC transporter substrate-binding protein n=1 Tax=unclassified Paenibacillus TaxID=185978 RepID=UPI000887E825|nr:MULTISPECIES: ABC transporter substrate-binding protein [unclassified Paenibacillus]SDD17082.1 NitT/TauT family transport system substrate-binding protein [Paenibacillus sp. cl123]SFW34885.1 NitT/TauT family transport system substrate-binding protein [Paenibacillus sp. UNCCL117]